MSGASPDPLFHYADTTAQIHATFVHGIDRLAGALQGMQECCTERYPGVDSALIHALRNYAAFTLDHDQWVRTVGQGFLAADTIGGVIPDGPPPPPPPPPHDPGSGVHGAERDTITPGDYVWQQTLYTGADLFEAGFMPDAAKNMRHYLNNTGKPQIFDPTALLRDVPEIKKDTDAYFAVFVDDINARIQREYTGQPLVFDITSAWEGGYAEPDMSKNWFYAMGGFSYAYGAEVIVTPPLGPVETQPKVQIRYQLHTYDYYNWDQGKAVNIGFVHIEDRMVGRLHRVGLAQEYELIGITPVQMMDYIYTGPTDSDPSEPALPEANSANRNDGWSDPGRSRNSRTGERMQERYENNKKK